MPLSTVLSALVLTALAAAAGGGLHWLAQRLGRQQSAHEQLVEKINDRLPQLQCAECGYPGCRPYAAAIAAGSADIDLCPPGGQQTATLLADLLNTPAPVMPGAPPIKIALIDTDRCVGCALCLPACPTDAIIGAPRYAHIVEPEHCVGCGLCLPPCPMDCIRMMDADTAAAA